MPFHLLDLTDMPILEQLHLEEALLRTDERNWCLINRGTPPAIVMGISGRPDELVHLDRIGSTPIIKRFSGGGTVVVDEQTLFVTLIGSADLLDGPCFPERIMRWSSDLYMEPLALWENDFIVGDRKVGGNAQYIRRGRWLHHTSFLWDYDPARMAWLKQPRRQPKYRAGRDHTNFLTRLCDHFASPEAFFSALRQRLAQKADLLPTAIPDLQTAHRRSTQIITDIQQLKSL